MSQATLEQLIETILKLSKREFSRLRHLDLDKSEISTDCMGFVFLLMREMGVKPKEISKNSKVVDLYHYTQANSYKTNIRHLKKYDLLMWKKETPPQSGDTGHVLVLLEKPLMIEERSYALKIAEVSKFSRGPCIRTINLQVDSEGSFKAIEWLPESSKVSQPKMIALQIFKRDLCPVCSFVNEACLCKWLPSEAYEAPPFKILQDPREKKVALRSTRILELCFKQSLYLNQELDSAECIDYLVFPDDQAQEVSTPEEFNLLKGKKLLLIDGSWKQVKGQLLRNKSLENIPRIKLNPPQTPMYKIRKAPSAAHISTLETYTLLWKNIYEDQRESAEKVEHAFQRMIQFQIDKMGRDIYQENYKHYPGFSE